METGHPTSVEPVTPNVHASLLISPELGILVDNLINWIENSMTE